MKCASVGDINTYIWIDRKDIKRYRLRLCWLSSPSPSHSQISLPEAEYHASIPRLSALLSADSVHAVYEDAMPLQLHAALQLGCVVEVLPGSQSKSLAADWQLNDFQVGWREKPDLKVLEESLGMTGQAKDLSQTKTKGSKNRDTETSNRVAFLPSSLLLSH
jgi:hypothetical protein